MGYKMGFIMFKPRKNLNQNLLEKEVSTVDAGFLSL